MKKLIGLCFALLTSGIVFAADWYVCLGSFSKETNAKAHIQKLEKENIPVFQKEFINDKGVSLIRIFYDQAHENRNDARKFSEELEKRDEFKKLGIKGLWICQVERFLPPPPQPEPEPEVKKPELTAEDLARIYINSLDEDRLAALLQKILPPPPPLPPAVKPAEPAVEEEIPVVEEEIPVIEEKTPVIEEIVPVVKIEETPVIEIEEEPEEESGYQEYVLPSDYFDEDPEIVNKDAESENYESIPEADEVNVPESTQLLLQQFPQSSEYEIHQLHVFDKDNIDDSNEFVFFPDIALISDNVAVAEYIGTFNRKNISVMVSSSDDSFEAVEDFEFEDGVTPKTIRLRIAAGDLEGYIYENNGCTFIEGFTTDKKIYFALKSSDISQAEAVVFMKNYKNSKTWLLYPKISNN